MPALMQASTGFIAGVTIVIGIVALGMATELVSPRLGEGLGALVGALAFGVGLVFLVVGRSELFTENSLLLMTLTHAVQARSSGS